MHMPVAVRALAFEDGSRSFAKVVRPETFVDGTAPANWDTVEANVEHTLSWKVSADWATRLAKVKFEVLAHEGELLTVDTMTVTASESYGKMEITCSDVSSQVVDALYWLYADKDPGLTLSGGALRNGSTTLASGTSVYGEAAAYILGKMGYSPLTGARLNFVNEDLQINLSPSGARQYGYRDVEE